MNRGSLIGLLLLGLVAASLFAESSAWSCAPVQWTTPKGWYSGNLRQQSYFLKGCDQLVTRSDFYHCKPAQPWKQCEHTSECPTGQLCGEAMLPRMCVLCNTNSTNTVYDSAVVTTNVTAAMLAGKFWTIDDFFNHTGVDLIKMEENWSWSASGNALSHDSVWHRRSTWGDRADSDLFRSSTARYTLYNATHTREETAIFTRESRDDGSGGVYADSSVNYYPSSLPKV